MKNLVYILIFLYCCSCTKDKAMFPPVNMEVNHIENMNIISVRVGSWWIYYYSAYQASFHDTMRIKALCSITNTNNDTLILLQRQIGNFRPDTLYVLPTRSFISYYADREMTKLFDKYPYPIDLGRAWSDGIYPHDTSHTNSTPVILDWAQSNNGPVYKNYITVNRQASDSTGVLLRLTFIKPGIGILYYWSREQFNGDLQDYSISLISYHLAD